MNCAPGEVLLDVGAASPICMSVSDAAATIASAATIPGAYQPKVLNQTVSTIETDLGVSGTTLAVAGAIIGLVLLLSIMKK